jgi:hypothetical protein
MRTQNYIETVPQYFKIAAVALVAIYVGTILTIDSVLHSFGCSLCKDLNYTSKEMAMLQHDFRITFYFLSERMWIVVHKSST